MAGTSVDTAALQNMTNQLRESTSALDAVGSTEPPLPVVTTSSDKVGETLSEIMKAAAGLMAGAHDAADQIHASDGSYGQIDNDAGEGLRRIGEGVR